MKMYCCEFENTKDGSLNFTPENILNRQLIFTRQLTPYQRKNYRWIEYMTEAGNSQEEIIKGLMDGYPEIKDITFEKITDETGHSWKAWVIKE